MSYIMRNSIYYNIYYIIVCIVLSYNIMYSLDNNMHYNSPFPPILGPPGPDAEAVRAARRAVARSPLPGDAGAAVGLPPQVSPRILGVTTNLHYVPVEIQYEVESSDASVQQGSPEGTVCAVLPPPPTKLTCASKPVCQTGFQITKQDVTLIRCQIAELTKNVYTKRGILFARCS